MMLPMLNSMVTELTPGQIPKPEEWKPI